MSGSGKKLQNNSRVQVSGSRACSFRSLHPTWTPKLCRITAFYGSWAIILPTLGGLGKPDQVAYLFELIMDNELRDLEQMIEYDRYEVSGHDLHASSFLLAYNLLLSV